MPKISLNAETFTVPLDKLIRDTANVRLTDREADVAALADNIASEGLLQNLGVRPVLDSKGELTEKYSVVIGGRRLAALKLLVKNKRLAKNADVVCALIAADAVTSAGLAENQHRVAMHPADAYAAFARMADEGLNEAGIAVRFGISALTVQKRLRLGRLSPVLLDALRTNAITEQVAQAFAITSDPEAQERVYAQREAGCWMDARTIRAMLTEGEVPRHDRRVSFVGLSAYEAAGGEVRRDLFNDDLAGTTLQDPALLDRLVMEKLSVEGDRLRADGWQSVVVSMTAPDDMRAFYTADFEREQPSDEAQARLDALASEHDTLVAKSEAEGLSDADEDRVEAIESEIDAIQAACNRYSPETMAGGKAFVFLDYNGLSVFHGLPRDRSAQDSSERMELADHDDAPGQNAGTGQMASSSKSELTAALGAELHAQRTAALQAQVADRPGLALRLVVQSLILERGYGGTRSVAKISGRGPYLKQTCPSIEDSKAFRALTDLHDRRGDHEPGEHAELLPWLLQLDDSEVLAVLAPLVASTVDAGVEDWSRGIGLSLAAQAACAAELDMNDYWSPTPESYFGRVSKAQIAQAVTDAGAGPFSVDGKKAEVATAAARLIAGTGWLPRVLRLPPTENDNTPGIEADVLPLAAE